MNEARDLLQAGAGSANEPDGATSHAVGKAETDAVKDAGPALGAHHEEAPRAGALLEDALVRDAYAVAEDEYVQAGGQRLVGLGRGIFARHADRGEIRLGGPARGADDRSGRPLARRVLDAAMAREESLGPLQGGATRRRALGAHRHHQ